MGKTFKYIDEEVVKKKGMEGTCPICEEETIIFYFMNDVDDPDVETDYVDEACAKCIHSVKFDFSSSHRSLNKVRSMINSHFPKGTLSGVERQERADKILGEFQRTPNMPSFAQNEDWPNCCGDYTEYIGEPHSETAGDLDHYEYWDHGICENPAGETIYDLTPSDKLAVIGGVSGFRCNGCNRFYWVFQCT